MKVRYTIEEMRIYGDFRVKVVVAEGPRVVIADGHVGPFSSREKAEIFVAESGGEV